MKKQFTNKSNTKVNEAHKVKKFIRFSDIDAINEKIQKTTPAPGIYYYKAPTEEKQFDLNDKIKVSIPIKFDDLPISTYTKIGLKKSKYFKMTDIQRSVIPHALAGRDIMMRSQTGSGKTLAFLIPIIELLYREKWGEIDGLGALILVSSRELAIQIFEVLKSIATNHSFSAGLVTGGKEIDFEKQLIGRMNLLICTPGRILQHMNETDTFDWTKIKIVIFDEVDRILDMGFAETVDQILTNLPKTAQIIIASATVSNRLKRISKLNLKQPEYITLSSYEDANNSNPTPDKLSHFYMLIREQDKIDILFSFIKDHLKSKIIVFTNCCKEVRFIYESFKKLKMGIPLFDMHGKMVQKKRTAIYYEFLEKKRAVLICTDIACRGIDFPEIDWVIQFDCPEDVDNYIHRAGRTARYRAQGKSLLFLYKSEYKFVDLLKERKIEIKKLNANSSRIFSISRTLQNLLSEDQELMKLAQKAFINYIKSIYLMLNKEVFDIHKLDTKELCKSMGLITEPVIQILTETNQNSKEDETCAIMKPKISKLQRLKQKIAEKKKANQENNKDMKLDNQSSQSYSNILVVKNKDIEKEEKSADKNEKENETEIKNEEKLSKSQQKKRLRKVNINAPFDTIKHIKLEEEEDEAKNNVEENSNEQFLELDMIKTGERTT